MKTTLLKRHASRIFITTFAFTFFLGFPALLLNAQTSSSSATPGTSTPGVNNSANGSTDPNNNTNGSSTSGNTTDPSNSNANPSGNYSSSTTTTTSSPSTTTSPNNNYSATTDDNNTTNNPRHGHGWGWLGLFGLIGLFGLARSSAPTTTSYSPKTSTPASPRIVT